MSGKPVVQDKAKLPRLRRLDLPMYERIYQAFRDTILNGQVFPGARLPATRALAQHYGVSRNTIIQAYDQLASEGYFETRHGSGTYVANELPENFVLSRQLSGTKKGVLKTKPPDKLWNAGKPPRPFQIGVPDMERFPTETWLKLYAKHVRSSPYSLANYELEDGHSSLKNTIASYLNTRKGVRCSSKQILVLPGSQQAQELVVRSLLRPGDQAWIEDPCYRGTRSALRQNGIKAIPVPLDENGLDVSYGLKKAPKAGLAIVTPSHQYPIGCSMPIGRRLELLQWANESEAWILEDDYDSEYRYRGKPIPAMQGIDEGNRVLYMGTFSKCLFPDIRIGYLVAPFSILDALKEMQATTGSYPPIAMQATLAAFMHDGHFERHIRRMRSRYSKLYYSLIEALEKNCSDYLTIGPREGGMHVTVFLKDTSKTATIQEEAGKQGIALSPIFKYASSKDSAQGFLLGFSCFGGKQLISSTRQLKKIFETIM